VCWTGETANHTSSTSIVDDARGMPLANIPGVERAIILSMRKMLEGMQLDTCKIAATIILRSKVVHKPAFFVCKQTRLTLGGSA